MKIRGLWEHCGLVLASLLHVTMFQVMRSLEAAYVIKSASKDDIVKLLDCLGVVRSLLAVQVGSDEEELLKTNIW